MKIQMRVRKQKSQFAVCICADGCDDLEVWKLYRVLPDAESAKEDFLRVIDESGEDYLYPVSRFVLMKLEPPTVKKLLAAHA